MKRRVALLFLLFVGFALSVPLSKGTTGFNRKRWLIHGRSWHGLRPSPISTSSEVIPEQWFLQPLDNFDSNYTETYKQRYWSSNKFYKPGGPIFLMLGGEGPEDSSWLTEEGLEWVTLAKNFNAKLFLIEHRYYGASGPEGAEYGNLKYLSSRQALADMANFIKAKNAEMKYENPKWIVFGGSYSGALAAWARQQYPELVYGSVASSAPIQAEVDFYQYLEVVKFAFNQIDNKCAENIHAGFDQLQKLMKTSADRKTARDFMNVCKTIDFESPENIHQFWQSMIGNFMGVVQYGGNNIGSYRTTLKPETLCNIINKNDTDVLKVWRRVLGY
ncbi:hypothetical protein L596_017016 [Steinernema carpocapsae]|uniref:Serine protease K12H4.7 n=1 Tax=Steinernema carpocapsae TaxID=34508 RepID=A0A4U5N142_STECR|nr:hypothetical protein L596_017016 [Steinernema carpocapsae]